MRKAIREVYGEALAKFGYSNKDIVVLDADVSGSTKSCLFKAVCPERFFNCGISEANMLAMAAGMASVGKIPFVNTFAIFLETIGLLATRTFCSYSQLPIKLIGAYGGLSDSFDGPSHHSLEDIAIMRSLPNMEVYVASDANQTEWLVKNAISRALPMYIRLSRDKMPDAYSESTDFEPGKGKVLREGQDLTIICCGLMVGNALIAADMLAAENISVRVVDMFCIKPLDTELIIRCAKETKAIITAEEHSIIGGLGGAVCETLCENGCAIKVARIGILDTHAECGPYQKLQSKYGLDAATIVNKARQLVYST